MTNCFITDSGVHDRNEDFKFGTECMNGRHNGTRYMNWKDTE